MKTKLLTHYLWEIDFPIQEKLMPYKQKIIDLYFKEINKVKTQGFLNVEFKNEFIRNKIQKIYYNILLDHFYLTEPLKDLKLFIYAQDNKRFESEWHSHYHCSTIASTFYLQLPKNGGGIEFADYNLGKNTIIKPQLNKLYVFPSWMYHRPLPQFDDTIRICFNIDYFCLGRPKPKDPYIPKLYKETNNLFLW